MPSDAVLQTDTMRTVIPVQGYIRQWGGLQACTQILLATALQSIMHRATFASVREAA